MLVIRGEFSLAHSPFVQVALSAGSRGGRLRGSYQSQASGLMLSDSGAVRSCIYADVAERLGLASRGHCRLHGIGGSVSSFLYQVQLGLASNVAASTSTFSRDLLVAEMNIDGLRTTLAGEVLGLLGCDFLAWVRLEIDGPQRTFELALHD